MNARIQLPKEAKRGEVIRVGILIQHPMETGYRSDAEGWWMTPASTAARKKPSR